MIDVMVSETVKPVRIDDTGKERTGKYGYRILFKEDTDDNKNQNVLSVLLNEDELLHLYWMIKNRCETRNLLKNVRSEQE